VSILRACNTSKAQYIHHPSPLTSHFSLMPTFPEGFVNQVIVPVCVIIAVAVVAIAVVAIAVITIVAVVTVITVIILIIAVSCMGESFLAQCNEFVILINSLVM